jgi:hypothetical protein
MRVIRKRIHLLRATPGPGRRDDDLEEEPLTYLEVAGDARRRSVDPVAALRIARIESEGAR